MSIQTLSRQSALHSEKPADAIRRVPSAPMLGRRAFTFMAARERLAASFPLASLPRRFFRL
jgi:hypothetical protein